MNFAQDKPLHGGHLAIFNAQIWTFEHLAVWRGPFQVCVRLYSTNLSWIMTSQCSLSRRIIHLHCSLLKAISSAGSFRGPRHNLQMILYTKAIAYCTNIFICVFVWVFFTIFRETSPAPVNYFMHQGHCRVQNLLKSICICISNCIFAGCYHYILFVFVSLRHHLQMIWYIKTYCTLRSLPKSICIQATLVHIQSMVMLILCGFILTSRLLAGLP